MRHAADNEDRVCAESDDRRGVLLRYTGRRLAVRSATDDANLGFHWIPGRTGIKIRSARSHYYHTPVHCSIYSLIRSIIMVEIGRIASEASWCTETCPTSSRS